MGMRRICCLPGVGISLVLFFLCAPSGLSDLTGIAVKQDSSPTPAEADFAIAEEQRYDDIMDLHREIRRMRDLWFKLGGLIRGETARIFRAKSAAKKDKVWKQAKDVFWQTGENLFVEYRGRNVFDRCLNIVNEYRESLQELLSDPEEVAQIDTVEALKLAEELQNVETLLRLQRVLYNKCIIDFLRTLLTAHQMTSQAFDHRVYNEIGSVVGVLEDTLTQLNEQRNR